MCVDKGLISKCYEINKVTDATSNSSKLSYSNSMCSYADITQENFHVTALSSCMSVACSSWL